MSNDDCISVLQDGVYSAFDKESTKETGEDDDNESKFIGFYYWLLLLIEVIVYDIDCLFFIVAVPIWQAPSVSEYYRDLNE